MTSFNLLNIYYQNVRGLRTKSESFLANVLLNNYDLIVLSESWLTEDFADAEYFYSNYTVFRRDRGAGDGRGARGGGVLIAVRRELCARRRDEWCSARDVDELWVSISIPCARAPPAPSSPATGHRASDSIRGALPRSTMDLHLACCYFSHNNSHSTLLQNFYENTSQLLLDNPNDSFLILGDFNISYADWFYDVNSTLQLNTNDDIKALHLSDFMNLNNLSQFNSCKNINGRILDLVLSNGSCNVVSSQSPLTREDCHHKSLEICFTLPFVACLKDCVRLKYIYHKANFVEISRGLLNVDWVKQLRGLTTEQSTYYFYSILNELIDKYIPKKSVASQSNFPPWYSRTLIKLVRRKLKVHAKWKKYRNDGDYQLFSSLRSREKELERICYKNYIDFSEEQITKNPRYFWSFIKSKQGSHNIPAYMTFNDKSSTDAETISNMFNDYFNSVFECHNTICSADPLVCGSNFSSISLSSVEITQCAVAKSFKQVDINKGAGFDNVHPIVIRKLCNELSVPLAIIYNKSISEGCFPTIWKRALVTPIPKGGNRHDVKQYRPISKLCILAKIFEKMVTSFLTIQLHHSIITEQHGFCRGRSVNTNLVTYTDFLLNALDDGYQVDAVYTDFSKAFDKINHSILIKKLSRIGMHGDLLRWIESYVGNRCQAVALKGYRSRFLNIPSGVPQGSHLGPFLFSLYINDINLCFSNSHHLLYADDTKIYRVVQSSDDCAKLQQDLYSFERFCSNNCMPLNLDKCYVITFSRKFHPIKYNYSISGRNIARVDFIRDLGVTLDSKLHFNKHIDCILVRAYKQLGLILRLGKPFTRGSTLKILYNAYVRSILEFGSVVWNPQYIVHQDRIERVQKKFLKSLDYRSGLCYDNYEESAKRHNVHSLVSRRCYLDSLFLYKIINNHIDSADLLHKVEFHVPRISSRSKSTFHVSFCHTNYAKNTFFRRTCTYHNKFLGEVDVFANSLYSFKKKVGELIFI